MKRKLSVVKSASRAPAKPGKGLLADVREMILTTRQTVAQGVNSALVLLYWKIGQRIRTDILNEKRADYGEKILHTLSAKLSWSHFRRIIYLDDPLKRDFYAEMCRLEKWSVRTLHERIQSMLFERTALSKKLAKLMALELKKLREEDRLDARFGFSRSVSAGFPALERHLRGGGYGGGHSARDGGGHSRIGRGFLFHGAPEAHAD